MPTPEQERFVPESILAIKLEDADIFLRTSKGEYQRILFSGLPLTDEEKTHWLAFLKYCKDNSLDVPTQYLTYECKILRYLQATKWVYPKAHDGVIAHATWTAETKPYIIPNQRVLDLLQMGFLYLHKRDKRGRCVVVMNVNVIKNFKPEDVPNMNLAVNFMLTYGIEKCAVPGLCETWVMVIDLDGVGLSQMPLRTLKTMLGAAQTNFRGRAYKIYILNAGYLIRGSFGIIKKMLDEFTAQKINVCGGDYKKQLLTQINADCLEVRFGGSVPDKKTNFFPPDMTMA